MKRKRIIAMILSVLFVLGSINLPAFADASMAGESTTVKFYIRNKVLDSMDNTIDFGIQFENVKDPSDVVTANIKYNDKAKYGYNRSAEAVLTEGKEYKIKLIQKTSKVNLLKASDIVDIPNVDEGSFIKETLDPNRTFTVKNTGVYQDGISKSIIVLNAIGNINNINVVDEEKNPVLDKIKFVLTNQLDKKEIINFESENGKTSFEMAVGTDYTLSIPQDENYELVSESQIYFYDNGKLTLYSNNKITEVTEFVVKKKAQQEKPNPENPKLGIDKEPKHDTITYRILDGKGNIIKPKDNPNLSLRAINKRNANQYNLDFEAKGDFYQATSTTEEAEYSIKLESDVYEMVGVYEFSVKYDIQSMGSRFSVVSNSKTTPSYYRLPDHEDKLTDNVFTILVKKPGEPDPVMPEEPEKPNPQPAPEEPNPQPAPEEPGEKEENIKLGLNRDNNTISFKVVDKEGKLLKASEIKDDIEVWSEDDQYAQKLAVEGDVFVYTIEGANYTTKYPIIKSDKYKMVNKIGFSARFSYGLGANINAVFEGEEKLEVTDPSTIPDKYFTIRVEKTGSETEEPQPEPEEPGKKENIGFVKEENGNYYLKLKVVKNGQALTEQIKLKTDSGEFPKDFIYEDGIYKYQLSAMNGENLNLAIDSEKYELVTKWEARVTNNWLGLRVSNFKFDDEAVEGLDKPEELDSKYFVLEVKEKGTVNPEPDPEEPVEKENIGFVKEADGKYYLKVKIVKDGQPLTEQIKLKTDPFEFAKEFVYEDGIYKYQLKATNGEDLNLVIDSEKYELKTKWEATVSGKTSGIRVSKFKFDGNPVEGLDKPEELDSKYFVLEVKEKGAVTPEPQPDPEPNPIKPSKVVLQGDKEVTLESKGGEYNFTIFVQPNTIEGNVKLNIVKAGKKVELEYKVEGEGIEKEVTITIPENKTIEVETYEVFFNATGSETEFQEDVKLTINVKGLEERVKGVIESISVKNPVLPLEGGEQSVTVKGSNLDTADKTLKLYKKVEGEYVEIELTDDILSQAFMGLDRIQTAILNIPGSKQPETYKVVVNVDDSSKEIEFKTDASGTNLPLVAVTPKSTFTVGDDTLVIHFHTKMEEVRENSIRDGFKVKIGDKVIDITEEDEVRHEGSIVEIKFAKAIFKDVQNAKLILGERSIKTEKGNQNIGNEVIINSETPYVKEANFTKGYQNLHTGGEVVLELKGFNLPEDIRVKINENNNKKTSVYSSDSTDNIITDLKIEGDANKKTISFTAPANTSGKLKTYSILVSLDEGRTYVTDLAASLDDRYKRLVFAVFAEGQDEKKPAISFIQIQSYGTEGGNEYNENIDLTHTNLPTNQESKKTELLIYGTNLDATKSAVRLIDPNGVYWTPVNDSSFDSSDRIIMVMKDAIKDGKTYGMSGQGNNMIMEIILPNGYKPIEQEGFEKGLTFKYEVAPDKVTYNEELTVTGTILYDGRGLKDLTSEIFTVKVRHVDKSGKDIVKPMEVKAYKHLPPNNFLYTRPLLDENAEYREDFIGYKIADTDELGTGLESTFGKHYYDWKPLKDIVNSKGEVVMVYDPKEDPAEEFVEIPDPLFLKVINKNLDPNRPDDQKVTKAEMESLEGISHWLDAEGKPASKGNAATPILKDNKKNLRGTEDFKFAISYGIKSIQGIKYAKNVKYIKLNENEISDISELSELDKLEVLELQRNRIKNIEPIKNLTNLVYLDLYNNLIEDLKPISGLTKLEHLDVHYNVRVTGDESNKTFHEGITDISPLANLINLKVIDMCENRISKGAEALNNLTKLEILEASTNELTTMDFVKYMPNMKDFSISKNHIANYEGLADIIAPKVIEQLDTGSVRMDFAGQFNKLEDPVAVNNNEVEFQGPFKGLKEVMEAIAAGFGQSLEAFQGMTMVESSVDGISASYDIATNKFNINLDSEYLDENKGQEVDLRLKINIFFSFAWTIDVKLDIQENADNIVATGEVAQFYKGLFNKYKKFDKKYEYLTEEGNNLAKLRGPLIEGNVIRYEDMKYLKTFYVKDRNVDEALVAPLKYAVNLEEFKVQLNDKKFERSLRNFDILKDKKKLKILYYQNQALGSDGKEIPNKPFIMINGINKIESLEDIRINATKIMNLNVFKGMTLKNLSVQDNMISNISALNEITITDRLDLDNNKITDISPLKGQDQIVTLYLLGNPITDIEPIKNLKALEALHLRKTNIESIEPLRGNTKIHRLYIDKCPDLKDYMDVVKTMTGLNSFYVDEISAEDFGWLKEFAVRDAVEAKYDEDAVRMYNFNNLVIDIEGEVKDGEFVVDNPLTDFESNPVTQDEYGDKNENVRFEDDKIMVKINPESQTVETYPIFVVHPEKGYGKWGQPAQITGNITLKLTDKSIRELAEAKEKALKELEELENLGEDKQGFVEKINNATTVEEVKKALEDAKAKDKANKEAEENPEPTPEPVEPEPEDPGHFYEPSPDRPKREPKKEEPKKEEVKEEPKQEKQEPKVTDKIEVSAPYLPVTLVDIPQNEIGTAISNMVARGILKGTGNNKFEPEVTITRAMVTEVFMRISKDQTFNPNVKFTDLEEGKWYTNSVKWAATKNIITGFEDGTFRPNQKVTKQEFAVMLDRMLREYGIEMPAEVAVDEVALAQLPEWSKASIIRMLKAGLIKIEDVQDLTKEFSRAELAVAINKVVEFLER